MMSIFLSIIFMLTAYSGKSSQAKFGDRLPENSTNYKTTCQKIIIKDTTILSTGWYYIVDTDNGFKLQLDKSNEVFFIDPKPIVVAKNFTTLEIYESIAGAQSYFGLTILLDAAGAKNWSIATEKAIGKQLAFILDNKLLYVAKVNAQISAGVTALNRGDYSKLELEKFKSIIEREK